MHHIFIHSSVDRHSVCFCVLVMVNSAAMNFGEHVSFWIMHDSATPLLGIHLEYILKWPSAMTQQSFSSSPSTPPPFLLAIIGYSYRVVSLVEGFHLSQLHGGWPPQSLGRHQGDFLSYLCSSFQPHFLPHAGIVPCPVLLGTGPSHCSLKFYAFNYSVSSHMHSLCLEIPSSFSLPVHFSLQFSPSVSLPWHLFLQHQVECTPSWSLLKSVL